MLPELATQFVDLIGIFQARRTSRASSSPTSRARPSGVATLRRPRKQETDSVTVSHTYTGDNLTDVPSQTRASATASGVRREKTAHRGRIRA